MNKVIIDGREYEFYLSVRATKDIANLCTDNQFENFEKDLNTKNDVDKFELIAGVCVALNKAAIMRRNYEEGKPIGDWENLEGALSMDLIDCLDPVYFINNVYTVALATLMGDTKSTVEVEPEKNAKKPVKKSK